MKDRFSMKSGEGRPFVSQPKLPLPIESDTDPFLGLESGGTEVYQSAMEMLYQALMKW